MFVHTTIEPYISAKEPYISAKEPCKSAKEPVYRDCIGCLPT